MGNFLDGLDDETREFMEASVSEEKKRAKYSTSKAKFHKWGKMGETVSHYLGFVRINEKHADKFGGKIALPKVYRLHKNITVSGKYAASGKFYNLFPEAKGFTMRCTGDDTCKVCKRQAEAMARLKEMLEDDPKNEVLKKQADQIKGMSDKERRLWVGIAHYCDESTDTWTKEIEVFDIAEYFWGCSVDTGIIKPRAISIREFKAQDPERFKKMSKDEQELAYRTECEPANPFPWDPSKAYIVELDRRGDFGASLKWECRVGDAWPYLPFKIPEGVTGKKLARYEAKLANAKANFQWLKEQFEEDKVPDLEKLYPILTEEEQSVFLGLDKEATIVDVKTEVKIEELEEDVETVDEDDEDDLDALDSDADDEDEEEAPAPKKAEKKAPAKKAPAKKVVVEEEDDEDDEDEEEAPAPKKVEKKAPAAKAKKAVVVEDEDEDEDGDLPDEDDEEEAPAPKKGKKKAVFVEEEDEEDDDLPF